MRKNLSIYIHIPFCVKKCVYCDFLSLVRMIRRSTGVGQSEKHMSRVFAENY